MGRTKYPLCYCSPANWGSFPFICLKHDKKHNPGLEVAAYIFIKRLPQTHDSSWVILLSCPPVGQSCNVTPSSSIRSSNYVRVLLSDNRSNECLYLEWHRLWHKLSQAPKQLIKKFHLVHGGSVPIPCVRSRIVIIKSFSWRLFPWDGHTDRLEERII